MGHVTPNSFGNDKKCLFLKKKEMPFITKCNGSVYALLLGFIDYKIYKNMKKKRTERDRDITQILLEISNFSEINI